MALIMLIITPLIAAFASLAVRSIIRPLEIIAALAALTEMVSLLVVAAEMSSPVVYAYGPYFYVDALGMVVILTVGLVGFAAALFSIGYLRQETAKQIIGFHRIRQYYVLFHLFLMAMFFAVMTVNPIMMWIAIEATTLATAFLISFYNKPTALEAAWKYLIINSIGLLLGFFGTLLFFTFVRNAAMGTFITWQMLWENASGLNPRLVKIAFIFILIGYGTKAGLAPMHTWLPDAHSKAPSPISAMLSGALLNVALFAILKFKLIADLVLGPAFSRDLLIFFGIFSILIPAFIIIVQKNYKRLFAYSSIEHMGIISLGFGFGGLGSFAALLHMIFHSLAKSLLFFCAGNILLKYGSTKLENIKGVLSTMPVTATLLFLGFLAITGVPPFGIFLTEAYILAAGMESHKAIAALALLLLSLIFVGFLRYVSALLFSKDEAALTRGEANYLTVAPPLLLLVLLMWGGFFLPAPLRTWIGAAAAFIG